MSLPDRMEPAEMLTTRPRVLELGTDSACGFATRMFVLLGADVVKVELPGGDPGRHLSPGFSTAGSDEEYGVAFHYMHQGKRSIALDVNEPDGARTLEQLLAWSDVVIIDQTFAQIPVVAQLVEQADSTVRTFVTPFGTSGPYADYKSLPGAVFGLGGELFMLPGGLGHQLFPDDPPLLIRGNVPEFDGGVIGALVSLAGMYHDSASSHVYDVATSEVNVSLNRWLVSHFDESGWIETRGTRGYPYAGMFPCADGYVMIQPSTENQWAHLVEMMGSPEWAAKPEYASGAERGKAGGIIRGKITEWLATKTKAELLALGMEFGVPTAPFRDAQEVRECAQFGSRDFFVPYGDSDGSPGAPAVPGLPFQLEPFGRPNLQRAPHLGEHTSELLDMLASANPSHE